MIAVALAAFIMAAGHDYAWHLLPHARRNDTGFVQRWIDSQVDNPNPTPLPRGVYIIRAPIVVHGKVMLDMTGSFFFDCIWLPRHWPEPIFDVREGSEIVLIGRGVITAFDCDSLRDRSTPFIGSTRR